MPDRDDWLTAAGVTAVILTIVALAVAAVLAFSWFS